MKPSELINSLKQKGIATFSFWSQNDKDYYKNVGSGICEGMSLDWLRRKFLKKRNFVTDEKYDPENHDLFSSVNSSMEKLDKKHMLIHRRYAHFRGENEILSRTPAFGDIKPWFDPTQKFAEEYNMNRKKTTGFFSSEIKLSGFERLKYFDLKGMSFNAIQTNEMLNQSTKVIIKRYAEEILNAVAANKISELANEGAGGKLAVDQAPTVFGIMINFHGEGNHATAYFHDTSQISSHHYFDPNAGEFTFKNADDFTTFLGDWWESAYPKKFRLEAEYIY